MRKTVLAVAVGFAMLPSAGFAEQAIGTAATSPPTAAAVSPSATGPGIASRDVAPQPGSPWFPGTKTGLDKVASDGVATRTVKAAPCGEAARETDGFTTCVGIRRGSVR
jgi:hypothetical protein